MKGGDKELEAIFGEEAAELLGRLGRLLIELESGAPGAESDPGRMRELFRVAHTLKGTAATVARSDFAEVAHALEGCLDRVRRGELIPDRRLIDVALGTADLLQTALRRKLTPEEVRVAIEGLDLARAHVEPAMPRRRRKGDKPQGFRELVGELERRLGELASGTAVAVAASNLVDFVDRLSQSVPSDRPVSARLLSAISAALAPHQNAPRLPRPVLDAIFMAADLMIADLAGQASDDEAKAIEKLLAGSSVAALPLPAEEASTSGESAATDSAPASVRIPISFLDSIYFRLDELVAIRLRADYQRRQIEEAQEALDSALTRGRTEPAGLISAVEAHKRRLDLTLRDLTEDVHDLGMVAQGLQEDMKEVRMVPIGPMLDPLRRMVRTLAADLGKQAALVVEGEHVRMDKGLLDLIRDPLVHLLRNAVDHGLERPEVRVAAGKPERGTIRIAVEARESQVWIEIIDDGAGISVERVREAALKRGLIESSDKLTDRELFNFIFSPGFTTRTEATETSGRGVGLDVVRENVARLGGRIEFFTTQGGGSQFSLVLPLTLSASQGLLVQAGKQTYCVPLSAVEEVIGIDPGQVGIAQARWATHWRRQTVTFTQLEDLLTGRASAKPESRVTTLILAVSDRRLAVGVEQVLGQEEVVVKGLAQGTPKLRFVAGATSLGDGRLVTVLDPAALMKEAAGVAVEAPAPEVRRTCVLVVDDALTSRTMIASLLERSGYHALLAHDGNAALAVLGREHVDLVVADVEMPNLDGMEMTRRIRASPALARLPVILLTSLDAPEDRARGAAAGANAFLVKKDFEPQAFLGLVAETTREPEGKR